MIKPLQPRWLWILAVCSTSFIHGQSPVSNWTYICLDSTKAKWGDYGDPPWLRYFGLASGDVNGDGQTDVVTGRNVYLGPGADLKQPWAKRDLGQNVDGILVLDVDGDPYRDIIAQALPDVYWIEATDGQGDNWRVRKIAEVPATSHVNSQGFATAQLVAGGASEILLAGNGNIYLIQVPDEPLAEPWPMRLVAANTSDEGIGVGDINADGRLDIVAGRRPEGQPEPLIVCWFENPGSPTGNWPDHEIGQTNHPADRLAVADLNGDTRADIVVCEERWPGLEPDGNIFAFLQPETTPASDWTRRRVATQYSTNNLDLADLNGDGHIDIVTCEHKGPGLELQIWTNDGQANFRKEVIDRGKESHLGTQLADIDQDGDLDILSIGWDAHQYVHLWRNEQISTDARQWRLLSSSSGELPVPNEGNQQTASLAIDADQNGAVDFFITERTAAPAVTWFRYLDGSWQRYVIEAGPLRIEAGAASYDIDQDGDEDIVFGGEGRSNEVWWWENPYPQYDPAIPWTRRSIKKTGKNKHHDQMFGDFDGDGQQELVFWNQGAAALMMAEIPADVKEVETWPFEVIYQYSNDSEMQPAVGLYGYPGWSTVNEHEGLAKIDMDGDGIEDIVGGGRWFKYDNGTFAERIIDASYTFSRSAAGQFVEGGRPEVMLVVGDGQGPLYMYEWHEWPQNHKRGTGTWKRTLLIEELDNGHTIDVLDFNQDGHLDLFTAEMRFGEGNPDAKIRILLGNGDGTFREMVIAEGYGVHEGRIVDLDGDGDLDVLGKPYTWKAPLLNIWINDGPLKR